MFSMKASAGVLNPRHFFGVELMAHVSSSMSLAMPVFLGMSRRMMPFVFSMTRWCQHIGAKALAALPAETVAVAVKTEAVSPRQLARVTVDTTVQTKAIAHPSDRHLERNHLKGPEGDAINAIRIAAGHNLRLLARWLRLLFILLLAAFIQIHIRQSIRTINHTAA
jgi:hypothetical protein